ncbi:MAG: response regulator transcription factor, partial [Deltaproteobacteria bacterium]|nr:response regulator transcription factor [Deltaproteobacteria bacterium]
AQKHIWVVEDDPGIAAQLVQGLRRAGLKVSLSTQDLDVRECLRAAPDLVILDLMLPVRSGFEILEDLRSRSSIPVLVITARGDLEDRLKAFELGAQDYVTKPFFVEEVLARVRVRVGDSVEADIVSFGGLDMHRDAREVRRGDAALGLTPYEYELLDYLVERAGRAISREDLSNKLVHGVPNANARSVDSHVAKLRKKLGDEAAAHIRTIRGLGYRFDLE